MPRNVLLSQVCYVVLSNCAFTLSMDILNVNALCSRKHVTT